MRILHIEDDEELRRNVKEGLKRESFAVDGAGTAKEGLRMISENVYDIVLLDLMMPGLNGLWALRTLRQSGFSGAIFIISGQGGEEERIQAYEADADDYMTKPVLLKVLTARIYAWLNRRGPFLPSETSGTTLSAGNIKLDLLKHRATVNGEFAPLTQKEFMILEYLIRHAGRAVTQTALAQAVWNLDFETGTNVVEVHVNRLRKKIDEDGKPSLIQTIRGSGYLIEKDQSRLLRLPP